MSTNSEQGFLFPAFLSGFVVCFLGDCQSDWGEMELSVVLICISFMAKRVEHFMCLLAICISSETVPWFSHLLVGLFLLFGFLSSLNILDINPLSVE
jgi:hypothetical protein